MNPETIFGKLGNTIYSLRSFENGLDESTFIPASQLTKVRNNLIHALDLANETTYRYDYRRKEEIKLKYPVKDLGDEFNVANRLAERFYADHGGVTKEYALETAERRKDSMTREIPVMHTRYCIRRELGMCKREISKIEEQYKEPFYIVSGKNRFRLQFNCSDCGMTLFSNYCRVSR